MYIAVGGEFTDRLRAFENNLTLGFDEFAVQLKDKPLNMNNVGTVRPDACLPTANKRQRSIQIRKR